MKQVVQALNSGQVETVDVAVPHVRPGHIFIQTSRSLISAGTERMLVEFGRAGWIEKARQQPEKVRQVLEKIRTDGLGPTLESVRAKLNQPIAMGFRSLAPMVRDATILATRSRGKTTRSASSVGPSSGTSRRCSN